MSLAAIIARIESMSPEQATIDAKALRDAINKAYQAAQLLYTFGRDDLKGEGATSSEGAAKKLFTDITNAASHLAPGVAALGGAQSAMSASKAQLPAIRAMQADTSNPFVSVFDNMRLAANRMSETYNPAMGLAASAAPKAPPTSNVNTPGEIGGVGGGGGNSGGGGGGGGGGTRVTSGNASDMGEYGGKTDPAGKPTGADNPSGPGSGPSSPTGGASSNDNSGPSNGARNAAADEPGGLDRGGRGTPDDESNHTNTAGMMPGGMPAGGSSGSPSGGRGGGGIGGAGGAGGVSELSRRLSASVPSSTTPAGQAPVSAGGPTSRNGMSPGGAPHGAGRGRAGEDSRHKSAHYLHTRDNGEEIVGSLPLVGPPVIGDWAPAGSSPDESAKEAAAEEPANPDKPLNLG